jgi:hypothetical protein
MPEREFKVSIHYEFERSDRAAPDLEVSPGYAWFVLPRNGSSLAKGLAPTLNEADAEARDAIEDLIRRGY